MSDDTSPPTRRRWRAEHQPAVRHWRHGFFTSFRRNDPVFVVASYLLVTAGAGIGSGAFGGKGATRITPDESAIVIAVSAVLMSVALLAVAVRLPFTSDRSPLSLGGTVFVGCMSAMSVTVVVARAEGVLSSAMWAMFGAMLLCAVVAAVTLPFCLRRPLSTRPVAHPGSE
ncbi:hypothetical protein QE406_002755 [Microbacterium testaceum]|nr:hypothetical protein [Microbacterium testaceum]